MKPLCVNKAGSIRENRLQDAASRSGWNRAAAVNLCMDCCVLSGPQRCECGEGRTVLVGPGNAEQEVADGPNAARSQQRRASRSDAFDELNIGVETKHDWLPAKSVRGSRMSSVKCHVTWDTGHMTLKTRPDSRPPAIPSPGAAFLPAGTPS